MCHSSRWEMWKMGGNQPMVHRHSWKQTTSQQARAACSNIFVNYFSLKKFKNKPNFGLYLKTGSPTSKILHLTDIHLDLSYTVGTNTDCGRPMCCSNDTEMAPSEDLAAGYWGSYSCDVPTWTLEDMLNHIKEHHLHVSKC